MFLIASAAFFPTKLTSQSLEKTIQMIVALFLQWHIFKYVGFHSSGDVNNRWQLPLCREKEGMGHVATVMYSMNAPLSILSAKNFNMSPILQTLKTSGSCFWCQEMNFISIFDSFRASMSTPLPMILAIFPTPLSLYAKHFEAITLLKHWKHFKLSMETYTLEDLKDGKKKEINCQLLKIILIMLILFLLHHSLYAVCLHHIQTWEIYSKGENKQKYKHFQRVALTILNSVLQKILLSTTCSRLLFSSECRTFILFL